MAFSIGGLGSGIDTAALVQSLMQAERIPQTKITARQQVAQKQVAAWTDLRTKMQAVQTAAEALRTPSKALGSVATSSDPTTLKATASPSSIPGQYSVKVDQLAVAQQQTKTGLGPLSMTVGAGRSYVTAGPDAARLGLETATAGVHSVQVVRSSSAPAVYGNAVLTTKPQAFSVALDGAAPKTFSLSKAEHTSEADLLADINGQIGSFATASIVGGRLQIQGKVEGSTTSLAFSGGAATALGLPTTVAKGQAASVVVDGVAQDVEPQAASPERTQALGSSGMTLTVGTSLRAGAATRVNVVVTTETSTLADVQAMLNATGSPVSASVLPQGDANTMVLQSSASGTGGAATIRAGAISVLTGFTTPVGSEAKNALGSVNGIAFDRSSNSLTDVVPGLTLDLLTKPADGLARTVTVGRDTTGTSDRAKALVDAMNALVLKVGSDTRYDVKSATGGPLVGDGTARSLTTTLFSHASTTVPSGTVRSLASLGIETTRSGQFSYDAATMKKALETDPEAVASVLSGFADSVATYAKSVTETGGVLASRRDGAQAQVDARQRQFDAMEVRLSATQKRYKAQYAALETSMASLSSMRSALSAALGSVNG